MKCPFCEKFCWEWVWKKIVAWFKSTCPFCDSTARCETVGYFVSDFCAACGRSSTDGWSEPHSWNIKTLKELEEN